jgi:hypothetical protein
VLWFWGHEHRMAIYGEFGVRGGIRAFGRCIGHGEYRACVVEFADKRHYPNNENLKIGYNGFARLTLRADRLTAEYVDLHGKVIVTEVWAAENGTVHRTRFETEPAIK